MHYAVHYIVQKGIIFTLTFISVSLTSVALKSGSIFTSESEESDEEVEEQGLMAVFMPSSLPGSFVSTFSGSFKKMRSLRLTVHFSSWNGAFCGSGLVLLLVDDAPCKVRQR